MESRKSKMARIFHFPISIFQPPPRLSCLCKFEILLDMAQQVWTKCPKIQHDTTEKKVIYHRICELGYYFLDFRERSSFPVWNLLCFQ